MANIFKAFMKKIKAKLERKKNLDQDAKLSEKTAPQKTEVKDETDLKTALSDMKAAEKDNASLSDEQSKSDTVEAGKRPHHHHHRPVIPYHPGKGLPNDEIMRRYWRERSRLGY